MFSSYFRFFYLNRKLFSKLENTFDRHLMKNDFFFAKFVMQMNYILESF